MEVWQRRVLGVFALGGGVAGLLNGLQLFAGDISVEIWITAAIALFLFGGSVWCGLKLLEGQPGAERTSLFFWCLQIPIIKTPLIAYEFYTTARGVLSFKVSADDFGSYHMKFGAFADAGGTFNWSLMRFDGEWKFAVNIVAIAAVCLLARSLRRPGSTLPAEE